MEHFVYLKLKSTKAWPQENEVCCCPFQEALEHVFRKEDLGPEKTAGCGP